MHRIDLNFYGVRGALSCDDERIARELRKDFEYFEASGAQPSTGCARKGREFGVELFLREPPAEPALRKRAFLRRPLFSAYERGTVRAVDYQGRGLAVFDFSAESGRIHSSDADLLRELGYLLALSRAGHGLDMSGLHRVHALGVERDGKGVLVLLPSGGGKTALCLRLLESRAARLLSEDTPLVSREGMLWPFPLRIGARLTEDLSAVPPACLRTMRRREHGEKRLVDLAYFRDRLSGPVAPRLVVDARREGLARTEASPAWRARSLFSLAGPLLAGVGTPQLLEYALRTDLAGVAGLAFVAASRAAALAVLSVRSRAARLRMSEDPQESSEALCRLIDGVRG